MNLIGIVEAVYQRHAPEQAWLTGLAEAARRYFGATSGALAWSSNSTGERHTLPGWASAGMEQAEAQALLLALLASSSHDARGKGERVRRVDPRLELGAPHSDASLEAVDLLRITAEEPGWRTLTIAVPVSAHDLPRPSLRRRCPAIERHLRAGLRLRKVTQERELAAPRSHASPSMQPEDTARALPHQMAMRGPFLSLAAEAGAARQDGAAPQRVWRMLVEGQLLCTDSFEAEGYHHIVVQPATESSTHRGRLTHRQRTVVALRSAGLPLKVLAAELDISTSTAAHDLQVGLHRLGLRSTNDLNASEATLQFAQSLTPSYFPHTGRRT